jgi:hypothetical protein
MLEEEVQELQEYGIEPAVIRHVNVTGSVWTRFMPEPLFRRHRPLILQLLNSCNS